MIKYGILLGRFQPLHFGHQHLIDKIISDGLEPIIILGTAQESRTKNNPYTPLERIHMLKLLYPDIQAYALDDSNSWDDWYDRLILVILLAVTDNLDEVTIYLHDKIEDLQNFTFRGIDYTNSSYSTLFHIDGMHTTKLPISDIQIRAKSIREDLEKNKQYLDIKIYNYIKGLS